MRGVIGHAGRRKDNRPGQQAWPVRVEATVRGELECEPVYEH